MSLTQSLTRTFPMTSMSRSYGPLVRSQSTVHNCRGNVGFTLNYSPFALLGMSTGTPTMMNSSGSFHLSRQTQSLLVTIWDLSLSPSTVSLICHGQTFLYSFDESPKQILSLKTLYAIWLQLKFHIRRQCTRDLTKYMHKVKWCFQTQSHVQQLLLNVNSYRWGLYIESLKVDFSSVCRTASRLKSKKCGQIFYIFSYPTITYINI